MIQLWIRLVTEGGTVLCYNVMLYCIVEVFCLTIGLPLQNTVYLWGFMSPYGLGACTVCA